MHYLEALHHLLGIAHYVLPLIKSGQIEARAVLLCCPLLALALLSLWPRRR